MIVTFMRPLPSLQAKPWAPHSGQRDEEFLRKQDHPISQMSKWKRPRTASLHGRQALSFRLKLNKEIMTPMISW